ncbi:MAG: hypothetical protein B0D92_05525 [Spirochaeta sp. LUC14_002_19_P3]|nr:MAG: hypothetical protein B0D92_05525 [Spirochaeta sp. LUC14_002_19_P3]
MKRIMLILLVAAAMSAYAQQFENESEFYVKTLPVNRIYLYNPGYRIDYIRQDSSIGTLWAPAEWFRKPATMGKVVYGKGNEYPYVSFFFKNGVLDHFRLYLIQNKLDDSWGDMGSEADYQGKFPSPDTIPTIEF